MYNIAEMKRLKASSVTDLWLVHGMDVSLNDEELWLDVLNRLSLSAEAMGLSITPVRTNARALQTDIVPWTQTGFSVILGAVAKLFAKAVPMALIGSYDKYEHCVPHASSPLVDPMWSCERQLVRHFSARVSRLEKLQTIAEQTPELLRQLRVCWQNPSGAYNCGLCEKCIRTRTELRIAGILESVDSFPKTDLAQDIAALELSLSEVRSPYVKRFWLELQSEASRVGAKNIVDAIGVMRRRNLSRKPKLVAAHQLRLRPRLRRALGPVAKALE